MSEGISVLEFTNPRAKGQAGNGRGVEACPYTPWGGCVFDDNLPDKYQCENGLCWSRGEYIQQYLRTVGLFNNDWRVTDDDLIRAMRYATQRLIPGGVGDVE
jgi:hypothetical protein